MSLENRKEFRPHERLDGAWEILGAPECPAWATRHDAQHYANARNKGTNHADAFADVMEARKRRDASITRALPLHDGE